MSGLPPGLQGLLRAARLRLLLITLLTLLPPGAGLLLLLNAHMPAAMLGAVALLIAAAAVALTVRAWRVLDRRWLARGLNLGLPQLEDSAELLLDTGELPPLATLQRTRLRARLEQATRQATLPDLRPPYHRGRLLLAAAAGLGLALLARQADPFGSALGHDAARTVQSGSATVRPHIQVQSPAYTGLPTQDIDTLDLKAPEGSTLQFSLALDPAPSAAALVFADGRRLELKPQDGSWSGSLHLDASALYRLELAGSPPGEAPLHRLDALPDQPPEIKVLAPDKTLNLLAEDQKTWELSFEASDDYGLGAAELSLSLAQGSGDNVKTTERKLALEGDGGARHRSYASTLDLGALGFSRGDDLIVRLSVADNRQPQPNVTQSASFILRWPEQAMRQGSGVEGPIQNATPAYFRSERQLIIDTEQLLSERGSLANDKFEARADTLGVDQKLLRLRYGQFLGEEFESNAEHDPRKPEAADEHGGTNAPQGGAAFGKEGNTVAEFGHVHDIAGAATLLDPQTRRSLKAALDEMWQAEGRLRQALPDQALPFEHKALDDIKEVQQAERIYLARAGLELPQPDLARRLSGDRAGLADRSAAAPAPQSGDEVISALYDAAAAGGAVDVAALQAWLQAHPDSAADALGLVAAADRLHSDPACRACRQELQAGLWPLLPPPPTAIAPRHAPDAAGSAYLQSLSATPEKAP
jgi:hypothetical protein